VSSHLSFQLCVDDNVTKVNGEVSLNREDNVSLRNSWMHEASVGIVRGEIWDDWIMVAYGER
jgi:hypothetical protein